MTALRRVLRKVWTRRHYNPDDATIGFLVDRSDHGVRQVYGKELLLARRPCFVEMDLLDCSGKERGFRPNAVAHTVP
ncbi:MAG TPA: hypothetical protein VFO41_15700 [Alphaproteobacteria bacterium]|nr:hypothetical protein [Alphaproteobacteria bacterium]